MHTLASLLFGKQNSDLVHEHTEIDSQIHSVVSLVQGSHCCTEEQAIEKPEFAISSGQLRTGNFFARARRLSKLS